MDIYHFIIQNQETIGAIVFGMVMFRFFFGFVVMNEKTRDDAGDTVLGLNTNFNGMYYVLQALFIFFPVKGQKYRWFIEFLNFMLIIQWIIIIIGLVVFVMNSTYIGVKEN